MTYGTFCRGELVHTGVSTDGQYAEFSVTVDKRFAPVRFSAKLGSALAAQLDDVSVGDTVLVSTSSPRLAVSKAGNKYVSYFALAISKEDPK